MMDDQKMIIPFTKCVICKVYIKYNDEFQIRMKGFSSAKNVDDADPQLNCRVQFAHVTCLDDFFSVTADNWEMVAHNKGD